MPQLTLLCAVLVILVIAVVAFLSFGPKSAEKFEPVAVSPCGIKTPWETSDQHTMDADDSAGTVALTPYSTQSRVSLERSAESPEVAEAPNPITGIGKTSMVRAMGDRYRRDEALARLSEYELQPGEPGYMEEVDDGAMSLLTAISRRSPPAARSPFCASASTDLDIDSDFLTDGPYGAAVLRAPSRATGVREALTSMRSLEPNDLTASRVGLGSTRMDPRYEPGPQKRDSLVPGGDASPAPGGYAGGPSLGALASTKFQTAGSWMLMPVYGFGDPEHDSVEAMATGQSGW
jgi:hypothetical protein